MAISNHAYSIVQTDYLAVQPNSTYHLSAWLRGELDAEESAGKWILRAYYYDASKSPLSYVNVDLSSSVPAILRQAQDRAGPSAATVSLPWPTRPTSECSCTTI